jgi:hypothetical protein
MSTGFSENAQDKTLAVMHISQASSQDLTIRQHSADRPDQRSCRLQPAPLAGRQLLKRDFTGHWQPARGCAMTSGETSTTSHDSTQVSDVRRTSDP